MGSCASLPVRWREPMSLLGVSVSPRREHATARPRRTRRCPCARSSASAARTASCGLGAAIAGAQHLGEIEHRVAVIATAGRSAPRARPPRARAPRASSQRPSRASTFACTLAPDDLRDDVVGRGVVGRLEAQLAGLGPAPLRVHRLREHRLRRRQEAASRSCAPGARRSARSGCSARSGWPASIRTNASRCETLEPRLPRSRSVSFASATSSAASSSSPRIACRTASGLIVHATATGLAATCSRKAVAALDRLVDVRRARAPRPSPATRGRRTARARRPLRRAQSAASRQASSARSICPTSHATCARSDHARQRPCALPAPSSTGSAASAMRSARSVAMLVSVSEPHELALDLRVRLRPRGSGGLRDRLVEHASPPRACGRRRTGRLPSIGRSAPRAAPSDSRSAIARSSSALAAAASPRASALSRRRLEAVDGARRGSALGRRPLRPSCAARTHACSRW